MPPKDYDLAIIGSGPGGYVAAIEASKKKKRVALIEAHQLGGTCLNCGCIPTKALLSRAEVLHSLKKATSYGIHIKDYHIDYAQMQGDTQQTVEFIRDNLASLLKSHGVEVVYGKASFVNPHELRIVSETTTETLKAKSIIIASGSSPLSIPAFPFDHQHILSSTSILQLKELPKSLAIVGGGYIGCEFASLFAELGVKVMMVESEENLLGHQEPAIRKVLEKALIARGVEIHTKQRVEQIEVKKGQTLLSLNSGSTLKAEKTLVAIGRSLHTESLHLTQAGLPPNAPIKVNEKMQTEVDHIYAIGDITGKAMLAHVASHQGIVAAKNACNEKAKMHYSAIPAVIFTHPEIATVGLSLKEAKKIYPHAKAGAFPFQALGKAQASLETEGFAQLVILPDTQEILGAQIVGSQAGNLIAPMALAIQNEVTLDCIQDTIHAHPTLAEVWLEAAYMALDAPLHLPPKK